MPCEISGEGLSFHGWKLVDGLFGLGGTGALPRGPFRANARRNMPEPLQIIVAAAGMLLASTVSSTLGFGIGLTAGPVLLLALEPQSAVVLINTSGLLPTALVVYQTWGRLKLREIAPIAVAGVLGAPVGAYVLGAVDPVAMRIGITFLVLALAAVITTGAGASLPRPKWLGPPLALVVSALITSSGVGGPIMALFLLDQERHRDELRGTLAAYFFVVMAVGSAGYAAGGLLTGERMLLVLVAIVPVLAGFRLSALLLRRMSRETFRKAALGLILAASIVVLLRELVSA